MYFVFVLMVMMVFSVYFGRKCVGFYRQFDPSAQELEEQSIAFIWRFCRFVYSARFKALPNHHQINYFVALLLTQFFMMASFVGILIAVLSGAVG